MKPKLLLIDVETAPMVCFAWRCFDENISVEQIITPGRIICWSAKWIGKDKVLYADERAGAKKMFSAIHALMSESDAVISYNGDRFDLQKLNGAFVEHRLPALPPITSIDLYKTVKKLGFQSGKLQFVAPFLKIGEKVKHEGFRLWRACLDGDADAWKRMRRYNEQDTRLLQGLYCLLKSHIKNHPYMGTPEKKNTPDCPACQSHMAQSRGTRRTKSYIIQRMHCLSCGGWYDGTRRKV